MLKDKTGDYVTLSGNQVGVLLIDYIITARKLTNTMPPHPAVLKSIVTTEMARAAANKNGVECFDTLHRLQVPRREDQAVRADRFAPVSVRV